MPRIPPTHPPASWIGPALLAGLALCGQLSYDWVQGRERPLTNPVQWCIVSAPPALVLRTTQTPSGQQTLRMGRTGELWEVPVKAADLYFTLLAWGYQPHRVYRSDLVGSRRFPPQGSLQLQALYPWVPVLRRPGLVLAVLAGLWGLWRWRRLRRWSLQQWQLLEALSHNRVEEGLLIGPYRVAGRLGRGGMAAVYEVVTDDGEVRALKLLNPGLDEESRRRFEREVRLSMPLRHPNLLAFYDFGEFCGRFYLVMEKLSGQHLNLAWKDRSLACRLEWLTQVATALQALHERGIVHRDLKPSNVMMCGSKVVLMDFGIAREVQGEGVSVAGQVLGTPGYMAPEQLMGEELKPCCDIYALGMMIYQACADRLAFQAETDLELLNRQVSQDPHPLRSLRADLSQEFCDWVMCLLSRNPTDRPPSAAAVAERLQFWSHQLQVP